MNLSYGRQRQGALDASVGGTPEGPYRVLNAELLRDGVAITFSDGKAALYSADLLYQFLDLASELTLDDEDGAEH